MVSKMDKELLTSPINRYIVEILKIIRNMEVENTLWPMAKCIKDNTKTVKKMAMEF